MIFTTLAAVKQYLGHTGPAGADELLTLLITNVSAGIGNYINRELELGPRTMLVDGTGGQRMVFNDTPVRSVEALRVNGQEIRQATGFGDFGYRFDNSKLVLQGAYFTRGLSNVEIQYTAGFETPPAELSQVAIETIALRFKEREWTGFNSKGLAGETVSFDRRDFSASARTAMSPYVRTFLL